MKYIKVGKGEDQKTYSEEDLSKMSPLELKRIKQQLHVGIEAVSIKLSRYRNENKEPKNSHEYWNKINTYKAVINMLKQSILIAGKYEKDSSSKAQSDREYWLYCYYMGSKELLGSEMVKDIEELAINKAGFSIDI